MMEKSDAIPSFCTVLLRGHSVVHLLEPGPSVAHVLRPEACVTEVGLVYDRGATASFDL